MYRINTYSGLIVTQKQIFKIYKCKRRWKMVRIRKHQRILYYFFYLSVIELSSETGTAWLPRRSNVYIWLTMKHRSFSWKSSEFKAWRKFRYGNIWNTSSDSPRNRIQIPGNMRKNSGTLSHTLSKTTADSRTGI